MNQVAEDLRKAVEVLDERGWCQGSPSERRMAGVEGVCVMEAVAVAVTGDEVYWSGGMADALPLGPRLRLKEANKAILAARSELVPEGFFGTDPMGNWWWNDLASTTVEDVKLVLKRAIEAEGNT